MKDFLLNNWESIILSLITISGTFTALTETTKDVDILDIIKRIFNAIILGRNR